MSPLIATTSMSAEYVKAEHDVVEVEVTETYELRRYVLRRGTPNDNVNLDADALPGTRHLAIRDGDGDVIATSTWSQRECPLEPGVRAVQLRAMAVHDDYQGRGLGGVLVDAGLALAGDLGADLVWANARDTAVPFYVTKGFDEVGDGFLTEDTHIPHHVVIRKL